MKRLFWILFASILICSLLVTVAPTAGAATPGFSDMAGHWAADVVTQAATLDLVSGYPDGSFRPDNLVTRAEFVKLALRVRALSLTPGTAGFGDVDGHWVATQGYLQAAVRAGLIVPSDYGPAGTVPAFEPDRPITRQEVAVIAARVLGKQSAAMVLRGATLHFSDGGPYWAQGFVAVARSAGVMQGYPDGSFGGERSLTRAEATAVTVRLLETAVAEGTLTAPAGLSPQAPRDVPVWEANSWRLDTVAFPARPAGVISDETELAAAPDGTLYLAGSGWSTTASGGVGANPNGNQVWQVAPGGQPVLFYQGSHLGPMAVGAGGALYMADRYQILRTSADGQATPWVGSGQDAFADGQGTAAGFRQITGLCADGAGNLYATEGGRLRKIDAQGNVSTLAGPTPLQQGALFPPGSSGVQASEGPGYLSTIAFNAGPCAADAAGNVYIADAGIRRVAPDGTGPDARLNNPSGLAVVGGQLYVAQASGSRLKVITGSAAVYPDGKALAPVPGPGLVPAWGKIGEVAPGPVTVALTLYTPVETVDLQADDQPLLPGGDPYYTLGWDFTGAAAGAHTLRVSADLPDGAVVQGATFTLQVTPGYQTPLSTVHYALLTPGAGSWLKGTMRIVVAGDGILQSVGIDGQTVVSGRDRILTADWDSTGVADGDHTVGLTHYVPEQAKSYTDHFTVHVINQSAPRREDDYGPGLRVYLNGQLHTYTMVPPRLVGDVPYLPFTETLQVLGFQVTWNSGSRTLTATNGSRTAALNIDTGDYTLTPPGSSGALANKPILAQDLTLVPWDFLSDVAGVNGSWDPGGKAVRIG